MNLPLSSVLLILSLIFCTLAVVGNAKLAFIEVNPGCFGRLLALFFGLTTLIAAICLLVFPVPALEGLKTQLAQLIQQNINYITESLQNS